MIDPQRGALCVGEFLKIRRGYQPLNSGCRGGDDLSRFIGAAIVFEDGYVGGFAGHSQIFVGYFHEKYLIAESNRLLQTISTPSQLINPQNHARRSHCQNLRVIGHRKPHYL